MEKNKNPYTALSKARAELQPMFPSSVLYDIVFEGLEQPKDKRKSLHGVTEYSDEMGPSKIIIDPRFKEQDLVNTLAHEMLHGEQLVLGKGSDVWEDEKPGDHNAPFTDELYQRIVKQGPKFKQQMLQERSKKLSPYELLIKREQEKVLGPAPDLMKR